MKAFRKLNQVSNACVGRIVSKREDIAMNAVCEHVSVRKIRRNWDSNSIYTNE